METSLPVILRLTISHTACFDFTRGLDIISHRHQASMYQILA